MTTESHQYEQVCRNEFAEIKGKLDDLDEAIRGNGRVGINTRLDRLERNNAVWMRLLWIVVGAGIATGIQWVVS